MEMLNKISEQKLGDILSRYQETYGEVPNHVRGDMYACSRTFGWL